MPTNLIKHLRLFARLHLPICITDTRSGADSVEEEEASAEAWMSRSSMKSRPEASPSRKRAPFCNPTPSSPITADQEEDEWEVYEIHGSGADDGGGGEERRRRADVLQPRSVQIRQTLLSHLQDVISLIGTLIGSRLGWKGKRIPNLSGIQTRPKAFLNKLMFQR